MPELSTVEHVSNNVWRVLGMNPGSHTLQGMELLTEFQMADLTKFQEHIDITNLK